MARDKTALKDFFDRWHGKGYEKGETQKFWAQLLRAIGYPYVDDVLYEHHLPSGGFIDVWIREANVLVEQKSFGISLDKPEERQGKMKTPLVQALDYIDELPLREQPQYVITCNFGLFRVYDRNQWGRSQIADHSFEFSLEEFFEHPEYMDFINDPTNSRLERQKQVSIQAGEMIGPLYDMLQKGYIAPESDEAERALKHALNVLCVRIVFCLYCEDADLFEKNAFYNYLKNVPANRIRIALKQLFRALDTKISERDPYETDVKKFPYVNGGLFHDDTEIPNFTEEMKDFLLEKVSRQIDWSQISPTIFGGIFESTLNPDTRRSGGMHYTTPENIHRVIDPLFLDSLKNEFISIRDEEGATPRKKKNALSKFHEKLCSLRFFDPACGSGNFLTETYICLRKLEDSVLRELRQGQMSFGFGDDEDAGRRVSLNQFYGIEINDFAVSVAETALWISRLKANGESEMLYDVGDDDFPLTDRANIIHNNALTMDWQDVLAASDCTYIMGNPPFVGSSKCDKKQKDEIVALYGKIKLANSLDYVSGWYYKACEYMNANKSIRAALVSTNSITQGEQIYPIWNTLINKFCVRIDYAWSSFYWSNDASDPAHVYCVIIGFSIGKPEPGKVFNPKDNSAKECSVISPYLRDLPPTLLAESIAEPLCDVPKMVLGDKPADEGNLILSPEEKDSIIRDYPETKKYFRRYIGADDLIKDKERWCLWMKGVKVSEIEQYPPILSRVNAVRAFRRKSSAPDTVIKAEVPTEFFRTPVFDVEYLVVPSTSTSKREYIPIGYSGADTIPSNSTSVIPEANHYLFGILTSQFHNAWMRVVCGRMGNGYRYTGKIVYNNFIWPNPTDIQRAAIEECAQNILDIRGTYADKTLDSLYSPDKMPDDLLTAHKALDKAVEAAYGVDFGGDEEKIVAHLFRLYAEKIKASNKSG